MGLPTEKPREEVGVKDIFRRKLMRSRLKWAGHMERMEEEWLMKRVDVLRVEDKMRRGRP